MTMPFRGIALSITLVALTAAGCKSGKTDMRVTSLQTRQQYVQTFEEGYARHNAAGDVDVVVTKEFRPLNRVVGGERTTGSAAGEKLDHNLRQVLHVRVLWQPMRGTKTDSPTATNATLSWYVFDDVGQPRMIEYSGAAFVDVSRKGGKTILAVRNATLKPTGRAGDLNDPIGPAKVHGRIVAKNSRLRVEDLLSETRATVGAAQASARGVSQRGASSRLPAD